MALLAILLTPSYIRILGIESYGLIGFYTSLCAFFSIADFGFGDAFCREIARLSARDTKVQSPQLRTLELLYWVLGALLSTSLICLSPWIGQKWLHSQTAFSQEKLCYILRLMGVSFFFLWPQIFYSKGLSGLQAHLLNNNILIFGSSIRYLGALCLIWFYPTLVAFFYWQIFSSFFQTALALIFTWKKLSLHRMKMRFSFKDFSRVWKFSLGMGAIGITSVFLTQVDKFLVSHLFSLEILGIYCFSYTASSSLYYLVQPIVVYYYPLFIQCIEKQSFHSLKSTYQSACKLVLLIVSPWALLLIFFGKNIVFIWSSNSSLAEKCAPLIAWITSGIFLNCFISISFYMQFAFGHTRAILLQNLFFLLILTPVCFISAKIFGLTGVASFYLLLNLGYLMFNVPRVHQKLLAINR